MVWDIHTCDSALHQLPPCSAEEQSVRCQLNKAVPDPSKVCSSTLCAAATCLSSHGDILSNPARGLPGKFSLVVTNPKIPYTKVFQLADGSSSKTLETYSMICNDLYHVFRPLLYIILSAGKPNSSSSFSLSQMKTFYFLIDILHHRANHDLV